MFPSYHCEYSGNETPKELTLRNAKLVDPANLQRDPIPVVRLRYSNTRTKGRTLGDKRGLDNSAVLFGEIKKLANSAGSFVEFENYLGQTRMVTWDQRYLLWDKDKAQQIALDALLDWVKQFLLDGAS